MSLQLKDRVRTGCTTIGKAEIEIGANRAGFQNWDGITDGSDVYYALVEGNTWEVGYGVKTGTEITRNLLSSSTGSLISLNGTAEVFETYPAEKSVILNLDDNIFLPDSNIQAKKFIGDGSSLTNIPTSADTYTKAEIDAQQDAQDDAITANDSAIVTNENNILTNSSNIAQNTADIVTNTGNISSNTTAIGDLSGRVLKNEEDIEVLNEGMFFASTYDARYPASANRPPADGDLYLQNGMAFTYSFSEVNIIYASKTDQMGNVRPYTALRVGDKLILNQGDGSPNFGRYTVTGIDKQTDYVIITVTYVVGQGSVINGDTVGLQGFPASSGGSGGIPEAPIDGKQYGRQDAEWTEVESSTPTPEALVWEDKTADREFNTTYTNTNEVPLYVQLYVGAVGKGNYIEVEIDGKTQGYAGNGSGGTVDGLNSLNNPLYIIPAGKKYKVILTGSLVDYKWKEARMPVAVGGGTVTTVDTAIGMVAPFAMDSVPTGWLHCDGSAVSRDTYSLLYSKIGDLYGAGDGSTTFNIPNLGEDFIRGSSDAIPVGNKE